MGAKGVNIVNSSDALVANGVNIYDSSALSNASTNGTDVEQTKHNLAEIARRQPSSDGYHRGEEQPADRRHELEHNQDGDSISSKHSTLR